MMKNSLFLKAGAMLLLVSSVVLSGGSGNEPPVLTPAELRSDLDQLFRILEDVHPNLYAHISRETLLRRRDSLRSSWDHPLTALDFWRDVSPLVAGIMDGHTYLNLDRKRWNEMQGDSGKVFPFHVKIREDRLWVIAAVSDEPNIPAGSEILAINGFPSETIIRELRRRISGERMSFRDNIISRGFPVFLWALKPDWGPDYIVDIDTGTGKTSERFNISGVAPEKWRGLKSRAGPYTRRAFPDQKVMLIDFRSMRDKRAFRDFLKSTFRQIREDSITDLIIDLRRNGGGNSRLGDALIAYLTDQPYSQITKMKIKTSAEVKKYLIHHYLRWWQWPLLPLAFFHSQGRALLFKTNGTITSFPVEDHTPEAVKDRFTGSVYVLIGPHTFSSANMLANTIKCYRLGTLVGEETGGLTIAYGDVIPFTLENTQLVGGVSYKYFVHPCGKHDLHGVVPDIPFQEPLNTDQESPDPLLEYTLNLIAEKRHRD